ncbi:EAL domain-containing protein [uncultured Roseobacter sp.]|uniref:sensor domain-containing protein n=1 Tax=uncultured Roseobacter sp. TaxID=114847 RepID=UPI0026049275|nr:EAL domain-containing protein [uncultured Roseobacter sp.]
MSVIPSQILEQVPLKCAEGLGLALASDQDGAVMVFKWCNKAFSETTGYSSDDAIGQRGKILIGPDTEQGTHLLIIDKLMKWERFSVISNSNRKSGEPYRARMSWTPLSDPENGDRWWLCSLIELDSALETSAPARSDTGTAPDGAVVTKYSEEILRLEKENRRLNELARTVTKESNEDPLTGLSNRRHFEVEFKAWVAALRKGGPDFALIYIDLDRFKPVNDTLGHDAGDRVLVSVSHMLRRVSSETDLVARLGGDEFIIMKPLGESALNISALADRIVEEMRTPFTFDGKTVSCSASVGVAIADTKMSSPEQVIADADTAMYHAKAHGRGRWSFFTAEMHAESIATKRLATELLVAVDRREFVPFFQPLIDAATGRISSAEVLVRWRHPSKGLLPPAEFLDVAADMGILNQVDEIVFSQLRELLEVFDTSEIELPKVAINVSAGRLTDPTFIHDIRTSGISPGRLTVEILESVYLERMGDLVSWAIDELNEMGVTIAVDDFGTGHASVQGLLHIKPDLLKIDRQFIQPMVENETSRGLVASIAAIGKSLGTKIVAEGIESEAHAYLARDMGCDHLQGFHFGRPMSAEDLRQKLIRTKGQFWHPAPDMSVTAGAVTRGSTA